MSHPTNADESGTSLTSAGLTLVLASASPRRRELLARIGLTLAIHPMDLDESVLPEELPDAYVRRVAREKAEAALNALENGLGGDDGLSGASPIIAADTIVVVDGTILGKPSSSEDARRMLRLLAGRRHEVTTATCLIRDRRKAERAVTTQVAFRQLEPKEIDAYVASGEWRGKAGGYAVQGVAAAFITELRGSLTNVIGLPLAEVLADLRALGAVPAYPPAAFPFLG
jgi:septum formation protein